MFWSDLHLSGAMQCCLGFSLHQGSCHWTVSPMKVWCIGRELNPGRLRGRQAFYHWTTVSHIMPSCARDEWDQTLRKINLDHHHFVSYYCHSSSHHFVSYHYYSSSSFSSAFIRQKQRPWSPQIINSHVRTPTLAYALPLDHPPLKYRSRFPSDSVTRLRLMERALQTDLELNWCIMFVLFLCCAGSVVDKGHDPRKSCESYSGGPRTSDWLAAHPKISLLQHLGEGTSANKDIIH